MRLNPLLGLSFVLLLSPCASGSSGIEKGDALASGPDLPSLFFKSGQPARDAELMDALDDRLTDPDKVLGGVVQAAKANPEARIEISGHADLEECKAVDCRDLSRRRAKAVHDWLRTHGVSESALAAPKGYGHDRAIAADSTDSGRTYNRRVEFSLIWTR